MYIILGCVDVMETHRPSLLLSPRMIVLRVMDWSSAIFYGLFSVIITKLRLRLAHISFYKKLGLCLAHMSFHRMLCLRLAEISFY